MNKVIKRQALAFSKENQYICKNITYSKVIFMIVQFSVGNYLSFKELSTLSLVTTNLKETAIPETDSMTEMGDAILQYFMGPPFMVQMRQVNPILQKRSQHSNGLL